jgi:ankyrin repeat protein
MKSVADIHEDIQTRHQKASSGRFGHFFLQWIKFNENSDDLYRARGEAGETYLQYRLHLEDVEEAAVIFDTILAYWKEMEQDPRIYAYLTVEDNEGNGIWHYLAATLRRHEGKATLRMARQLLSMDIDFSRRNKLGQSPLSRMLLPDPRWQSLNALIQTKHLTIENIESAISEGTKDEQKRANLMCFLFTTDIEKNKGLLCQHILRTAIQPQADSTLRAATCRLFYDYIGEKDSAPPFFKLIDISNHAMFDDLLRLLMQNTIETVTTMGASDVATRKTYAQLLLAKRILRRDAAGEGLLFKTLASKKYTHLAKISSLMRNDELKIVHMVRGERVRKPVTVDKTSPAPENPLLSLILQQDRDGNTVFHYAVTSDDLRAIRYLLAGLAPNDMHAIITALPNKIGLSLMDLATDPEGSKKKLFVAAKANVISQSRAKIMVTGLSLSKGEVRDYLVKELNEIQELAKSVGRKGPLPPTFTLPSKPARAT